MTFQPEKIQKDHILKAIEDIDKHKVEIKPSTKFDVFYSGKRYPPKEVMRLAHKHATKEYVWERSGGEPTNKYLKAFGFVVINKNIDLKQALQPFISQYKELITGSTDYDEVYKWEAVATFQNNWDLSASDIPTMLETAFPGNNNLWTSNNYYPIAMLRAFAEMNPEKVVAALTDLFDENTQLEDRIKVYKKAMDELLAERNLKEEATDRHHYQDGRTIGLLLSFNAPTTYFLFKYSILKAFCEKFNLNAPKKGDVVNQILINNEISELVKNILIEDQELLKIHENRLTSASYKEANYNLLTQDFIYSIINYLEKEPNYWLYAPGENAEKWDQFYAEGIMALGWDELGDLSKYHSKKEVVSALQEIHSTDGSKKNDATANFDFGNKMSIGDVVFVKKGTQTLLGYGVVTSASIYDENRTEYKNIRKVDWQKKGTWNAGHRLAIKTLTDITSYDSPETDYAKYHERLMGIINNETTVDTKKQVMDIAMNTILYGPPGTGKTYKTKELAVNIVNPEFTVPSELSKEEKRKALILEYDRLFELGQISFTTFHQSFSYEDFVEGIKPNTDSSELSYTVEKGIFKKICEAASQKEASNFKDAYDKLVQELLENDNEYLVLQTPTGKNFRVNVNSKSNLTLYTSEKINPMGTLTFEGIYNYFKGSREYLGWEGYAKGIVDYLSSTYNVVVSEKKYKNHVLIIDEINRGNISAIFGELITLLEPDKRLGASEQLTVKLPYSKASFGVPSNVHIIGTMNTADRSVEALDTALRRRFVFEEVMPDPSLLSNIRFDDFTLEMVLETINTRIEALLDRDHTIGHSYFIKLESGDTSGLLHVFKNNIIPLLQEYFYADYEKIALVLGNGFVQEKASQKDIFPKINNLDIPELGTTYELISPIEDIEVAVKELLNISNE